MRLRFGTITGLVLLTVSLRADAGWLTTRGNPQRTGLVAANGDLTAPAIRWRYYLGGYADARTFQAIDRSMVAGSHDLVYLAASGRVEARRADDTVVWQAPLSGVDRVVGVADLDGDGHREVIALSRYSGRVFVHDASSGALRWSSPAGRYPQVQVAQLRDIDGDGVVDLYVSAWGSFGSAAPQYADAWRFTSGGAGAPLSAAPLFTIDMRTRDYDRAENDAWADVDGDGRRELVAFGDRMVYVYSSTTGALVASGDVGYIPFAQGATIVADVDHDGDDEIVVFTNTAYRADRNQRHVAVLDVDTSGAVVVRWEHGVGDVVNDRHSYVGESVVDVDGDGTLEVVSSFYAAATGAWTTYVRAGATGAIVATLPGEIVGAADVDADGAAEIAVRPAPGQLGVSVWDITAAGPSLRWAQLDSVWLEEADPATLQQQSLSQRTIMIDVDGDHAREVVIGQHHAAGWRVQAFDLGQAMPIAKRTYQLPDRVSLLAVQRSVMSGADHVLVARSDGYLAVLDRDLAPTNQCVYPHGTVPGLRLGGYYTGWRGINATAMAADLFGTSAEDVVVRDSRRALVALDPANGSVSQPPARVWEAMDQRWHPALVDVDGDGRAEVLSGDVAAATLRRGSDGDVLWNAAVSGDQNGNGTGVDLDGDGSQEIVYVTFDPSTGEQVLGVLSATGAPRWPEIRRMSSGCGRGSFSIADLNGDGVGDVAAQLGCRLVTIDGATGATLGDRYSGQLSMAPLLADVDGDQNPDLLSNGFSDVYVTYDSAAGQLSERAQLANSYPGEAVYYQYGALVQCPGGPRYFYTPQNTSHLRVVDPSSVSVVMDAYLAGGNAYDSIAQMPPPGTAPAFIGNVNAVSNLAGDGEPRLLIGSTDGYVYALHACAANPAGLVDWTQHFDAPVGEPVPADVDGDGLAEVVVSVGDGYLYAIDRETTAAPRSIGEVGSGGELDDVDADQGLVMAWDAVPGAAGYEIAVVDGVGAAVTSPQFRNVGNVTRVAVDGLSLQPGLRYYSVVRAIAPDGTRSFEQISDGFRWVERTADPGEPGKSDVLDDRTLDAPAGCGCRSTDGRTAAPLVILVVLALTRRRRRRSAGRAPC